MMPSHVVAEPHTGFMYTRGTDDQPLTLATASELARTLNGAMPEPLRGYVVYRLMEDVQPEEES